MPRALVTGGAGFIGASVVKLLIGAGYKVIILDNLTSGYQENLKPFPTARFIKGDVRNAVLVEDLVNQVDVIFHLAAMVGNLRSIEQPIEDSEVNVIGTLRVLEAAKRAKVRKIVCSSSAAIFGELKSIPISEDHPTEPDSPYGVSKLAEEKHCLAYAKLYEMEVICLRYFNVYGVNQRYDSYGNVIPIFAQRMLNNVPLTVYGDGEQTRDFVHVSDVARANVLAAQAHGISGAFNIASGEAMTINRLVEIMGDVSGIVPVIEHGPPRKGDVLHSRADISAAQKQLGYRPMVEMMEGMTEYMAWGRSEMIK